MTNRWSQVFYSAALMVCGMVFGAQPAAARDVPISIAWSGTKPNVIALQTAGGTMEFEEREGTDAFQLSIPVDEKEVSVRTVLVTYGSQTFELFLKVNAFIDEISFRLVLDPAISCTRRGIRANGRTRNISEALKAVLQLSQLLSIKAENECGRLKAEATRARYDRMIELTQHSNGLFQPNDKIKAEYLASVSGRSLRSAKARTEDYAQQARGLEAVQLRVQRDEAVEEKDYTTASQINNVMISRVESDEALESAYRAEGMTQRRLEMDQGFFETKVQMVNRQPLEPSAI